MDLASRSIRLAGVLLGAFSLTAAAPASADPFGHGGDRGRRPGLIRHGSGYGHVGPRHRVRHHDRHRGHHVRKHHRRHHAHGHRRHRHRHRELYYGGYWGHRPHYVYRSYRYGPRVHVYRYESPYFCAPCEHYFGSELVFHDHIHHHHHVPLIEVPFVIVHTVLGWIFYG